MKKFKIMLALLVAVFALVSCSENINEFDSETYGSSRDVEFNSSLKTIIPEGDIECTLIDKSTNQPLIMTGYHSIVSGVSKLSFNSYLRLGDYLMSSIKYIDQEGTVRTNEMGCTLSVDASSSVPVPADFDATWNLFGLGTEDSPYLIINLDSFTTIDDIVNSDGGSAGIHFKQIFDIDFFEFVLSDSGFKGIATSPSRPFRGYYNGNNCKMTSLIINRVAPENQDKVSSEVENPTALFCNVTGAVIKNLTIESPSISGQDWTGALVGAVVGQGGDETSSSSVINCHLAFDKNYKDLQIIGRKYVGGLVGGVDEYASLFIQNCSTEEGNLIKAGTPEVGGGFLGGIVGAAILDSQISIDNCENNAAISTNTTACVGGIIGAAFNAAISNVTNNAVISNSYSDSFATAGIIGGSGDMSVVAAVNNAAISGARGVAGILGSTAYDIENELYADASLSNCHNYAPINGTQSLGGIVGESQALFYNCYNTGSVGDADMTADYAGGIIGLAPGCIATGCANKGDIYGVVSGGIVGTCHIYAIQGNSNFGNIASVSKAGGIMGIGGETGNVTYCANYGETYSKAAVCGGIAGALGKATVSDYTRLKMVLLSDAVTDALYLKFLYKTYVSPSSGDSSLSRVMAKAKPASSIFKAVKSARDIIVTAVNWDNGEEFEGWSTSSDQLITENTTALDAKMQDDVASSCKNAYNGIVNLNGEDIATQFNNNIVKLNETMATEDESDTFSDNAATYLTDISKKDTETEEITSIVLSAFKCAVAIASIVVPGRFAQTVQTTKLFGNNVLSAINYAVSTDNTAENVISASHLVNFGTSKYNGNGLVGQAGDRIRLQYSLQAGTGATYSFADVCNHNGSVCEYLVAIGEDILPYSNISQGVDNNHCLVYPDTSAEDFVSGDAFKKYDSNYWRAQGTSGFQMPYNSLFLNFK